MTALPSSEDRWPQAPDDRVAGPLVVGTDALPLRAVLCGSYRRDRPGLARAHADLQRRFVVLSPLSLDFVDAEASFVRLPHETSLPAVKIEQNHLDALMEADFVWLHCPDGYLGTSGTYELGHAKALGIPVYASTAPDDEIYRELVNVVASPDAIQIEQTRLEPGNPLRTLQRYYERTAARRGWATESAQDTLLLITEEMGELARAVRKTAGLARDGAWEGQDPAAEMADVQLYLVHLANALGIDLAGAVTEKELVNARRVAARESAA